MLFRSNLVEPALFVFAVVAIFSLSLMLYRQYRLRLKAEAELESRQNQIYSFSKAINDLEINTIQKENEILNSKLEVKRREFINVAQNISRQKEFLENLAARIESIPPEKGQNNQVPELKEISTSIRQKMTFSGEMEEFYGQIETVHKDFRMKLESSFPGLTNQEIKLAMLLRLNFSSKELSSLMNISAKSVEISRYRLRKRLGLSRSEKLIQFINNL